VTFGIGPAGTGKTYLAMGAAVQALRAKQVNRLILTRPAVEAGERLGFLPGTLHEKIDPYLKPLWDALHDMMEAEELDRPRRPRHDRGRAPGLHAWSHPQRCVHRARRGAEHHRRADEDVPDPDRVQLQGGRHRVTSARSTCPREAVGAAGRADILDGIEGVAFARLRSGDVVRHHIVQRIVEAYEAHDEAPGGATTGRVGARCPAAGS
jgi:phosphate starvation-inducible protein PhoH and related proteins